ncbi:MULTISPECIES: hypothetical protein [Saccharothrix]|uniref:hypothetical protein n=1 Tax=Saccharothrix TaxID=2071 RepID=UPI00093BD2B1|nr:hypothetical protein [Saccharothrix sp. CB00851]OKI36416.1 hypothetical protein A6A25_21990 [Saccharothrix sp. CB00851]
MRQYRYFAILSKYSPNVDDPALVARKWTDEAGETREEVYTKDLEWAPGNTTWRIRTGKQDGEVVPITEEAARRFEEIQAERVRSYLPADGKYDYYAILDTGFSVESPRKLVRRWRSPQGLELEQRYTHGSGWKRSDVLYRISTDREDGEPVLITEEAADRVKEVLAERVRRARAEE